MADFSSFTSGIATNLTPNGDILNRKIDFQREKFLKGVSTTKHGKKEDPTYIYFKFIFDFGNSGIIDPETFLAPSPLFRSLNRTADQRANELTDASQKRSEDQNSAGFDPNDFQNVINTLLEEKADGSFITDLDFFYGAKSKNSRLAQGETFFPMNDTIAYMGAQKFLAQRSSKRQQMLESFKKGLDFVNRECPYYFQSLSGLDSLLKSEIKNYHKTTSSIKRAGTLTIDCIESIDMRMFSLAELYRKAIYDFTYHRTMVPENLRKFRMWLVVTELRNIQLTYGVNDLLNPFTLPGVSQGLDFADNFNSQTGLLDKVQGIYNKSTNTQDPTSEKVGSYNMGPYTFIYQFDQCEFDFDNSFPSYTTIDNKGGQAVNFQFKINVGRVKDYKIQFNQLGDVLKKNNNLAQMVLSDIWGSSDSGYTDYDYKNTVGVGDISYDDKKDPGEYFANLASNFVTNTVADLKNQGVSVLQDKILGNIYGFGGINLQQAGSSVQNVISTIESGIPNPFENNTPQAKGLGGPGQRQYPTLNSDVYPSVPEPVGQSLGNVLPGGGQTGGSLSGDAYQNVPGSDLGLPSRQYPVNNSDEYTNTPGSDLGVPDRIYPNPGGDIYQNVPGSDLGLPTRQYVSNNSDEYSDVPGSDLGVPGRVYNPPGGDVYSDVPGSDLGLPTRQYVSNNSDEYSDVPGSDLGVPDRVYSIPGGDAYQNVPGSDLGLPDRQYSNSNGDEYNNVPGSDLGPSDRVYEAPVGDVYKNVSGPDLGLPDRQYKDSRADEYNNVPGSDLGPSDRVYEAPVGDAYKNTPGSDLGLPNRQYKDSRADEYDNVPGTDLGPKGRVYNDPKGDTYSDTPGRDLGLPSREYPSNNLDEFKNVPGIDLGPKGRSYPPTRGDSYEKTPGSDLGVPDRQYPSNNSDEYGDIKTPDIKNLGRTYN
jgi:hypothetical protein